MCVCQHFQTSSPPKTLGRLKPNFMCRLLGTGERKFVLGPGHMTKMAAMRIYGKNLKTSLTLGLQHRVHEYYQVCSNDDPGLT